MTRSRTLVGVSAAIALMAVVAACSPAAEKKAEAPAVTEEPAAAAPEPAPAAPAATAATAPAAGAVMLDVKDTKGVSLSGDPAAGARVFRQCMTCHVTTAGVNKVGPSLHGIIGRKAGTVPGFRYSDGNKNSGITWTEQELYTYLENPRAKVPGTIMAFVGLKNSQQRADVIAYLKANAQ